MILCTIGIHTLLDTLVFKLVISSLTLRKSTIYINRNFRVNGIVVRTVVGNVQLTITVNECQVTVTVKTTCMSSTQCNKVAMIYVMD